MRAELEHVYRQHRQALFSLALAITGCSGLAEDAVHEAFLRMCRLQNRPAGRLAAYVFATVRNAAVDHIRRTKRDQKMAETLFIESRNPADARSRKAEDTSGDLLSRLKEEIESLEGGMREIVVMKIYGELTFDEIGKILDTAPATIATKYRRTLITIEEKLRQYL